MLRPILLLIFSLFAPALIAQTPAEAHERIRRNLADRNYHAAFNELRELERRDAPRFRANNYDYLLGRVAEKIGDVATAMASFQGVAGRGSILKEYALWHLARGARASGNLMLERVYLHELTAFSPNSLLTPPANRRLAESWFDSENYDLTIRQLELTRRAPETSPGRSAGSPNSRRDQALLAEAYLRSGNVTKARELFNRLTVDLANPSQPDDFALAGVRALDATEATQDAAGLTDQEHLRRAAIYQFNRDFEHARVHYSAIVNGHPTSGLVPEALFQIGRGYSQQNDPTEAVQWFERILERSPDHAVSEEALLQTASAYARLGKPREAIARYKKYIEKYPNGDRIDRAYLNIIDTLRDQREDIQAVKWAATTRERFKGSQPEALATFAEARVYLSRSDWESAIVALDRLLGMSDLGGGTAPGGTSLSEVRFLKAYSLEQARRYDEAVEAYLLVPDGRGEYYGERANERLRSMWQNESAQKHIEDKLQRLKTVRPTEPDASRRALQAALRLSTSSEDRSSLIASLRAAYAAVPAYANMPKLRLIERGRQTPIDPSEKTRPARPFTKAEELLFLGLYDEAAPELEVKNGAVPMKRDDRDPAPTTADLDYTLAVIYTRGDMAYRGAAFIESAWKLPADYQIELIPPEHIELLFPAPFADALVRHASSRDVDPRFLLSIMRQESRFRPDVKSYAAARGLMQFISTTSTRVAAELGRADFRQDDLYDPSTAILFGSHYVGNLFKLFPGQPPAVAASYNAGDDNMKRWLARSKSDQQERYVPEILFSQTKDYTWRVLANYRVYRMLYDEDLKRR